MKRKISYGVTLALCVLLILSACGRSTPPKRETPADFLERLEAELTPGTVQNNEAPPQQPDTADPSPVTPQRPGGRLTVLAPGHFRPILQQAARLMEYDRRFELEITTYNPETEADYWAYRLQSMFAAGEGFDLIFADPLFPMWDFARDGYLTEIHELINICSTFNRHDFYEEALQALTVNGELYFFPLGFGFQYIGINSRLPQEFINRFMQYGAITVSQMIDIYTDVLAAGLDLGRDDIWSLGDFMRMTSSRDMSIPGFMALNAVNDFVDIGSGT
ncbi:MAG: hypothetical protein FWC32_06350, partial [Firmicutes bacterium]|nr:hypothetical protein [Bacillota bacterium]